MPAIESIDHCDLLSSYTPDDPYGDVRKVAQIVNVTKLLLRWFDRNRGLRSRRKHYRKTYDELAALTQNAKNLHLAPVHLY